METLEHDGVVVRLDELGNGRRRVSVGSPDATRSCETAYPVELVESILRVSGPDWLCDEIERDENPRYVQRSLQYALLSYVDESAFAGKRVLDLGCGSGASSFVLARMFPQAAIVGVELVEDFVEIANKRAEFYRENRVTFHHSADGESLPEGIGQFDMVILSAVFEHLLPRERRTLLPNVWSHLNPGGIVFINQLPYRFSPIENHTTGLPLINYLPDRWTHRLANAFSRRDLPGNESWDELLRRGIRGGSPGEILGILENANDGPPSLLEPVHLGINDRIDLWFALSSGSRWPRAKAAIRAVLKLIRRVTGLTAVPDLSVAFRKG